MRGLMSDLNSSRKFVIVLLRLLNWEFVEVELGTELPD